MPRPDSASRHATAHRTCLWTVLTVFALASCSPNPIANTSAQGPPAPTSITRRHLDEQAPSGESTAWPNGGTPEITASRWLLEYRTMHWTDPGPATWIDRVRPYVTDTMHADNNTLRDGGGGADWDDLWRGAVRARSSTSHRSCQPKRPARTPRSTSR